MDRDIKKKASELVKEMPEDVLKRAYVYKQLQTEFNLTLEEIMYILGRMPPV